MTVKTSVLDAIGDTPLIRLNRASDATGCEILGKAEFMNPGQSVKDRAALGIIRDAEAKGLLRPGGRIVEGTAGNTGIGLAMVASALGYKTTIVIPRTQSQEKKDAIRLLGAELVEVDAVPYSNPDNYVRYSGRLAEELAKTEPNGVIWANQFDNVANRQAHFETTGPEIFEQTNGGRRLHLRHRLGRHPGRRRRRPAGPQAVGEDRPGRPARRLALQLVRRRRAEVGGTSISEGIGQGRITANLEGLAIDHPFRISDEEMLEQVFDLVQHEGLCLGGSTGINVAGAVRMAKAMGPGHTIVTILCDHGSRYQSKLFNPAFLAEKGLPTPPWM
jgi:cysteine synthase A